VGEHHWTDEFNESDDEHDLALAARRVQPLVA
jgi:hypothetical protein